ncbi:putative receptor [Klebsiella quasipneumoniae]|nr:putative receptor [Klebsiella quasipneumoniae]
MPLFNRFTRISAGWRFAYPAYKTIYLSEGYSTPYAWQAPPPGKDSGRGAACVPGGATLTRPTKSFTYQKATQHPRPGKRRAAGQRQQARSRLCAGWRFAYPAYNAIYLSEGYSTPQTRQAPRRRARTAGAVPLVCRVAATPYPAYNAIYLSEGYSTPQTRQAPPGKDSRRGAASVPGGGYALPGLEFVRPVVNFFTSLAETAGAGGLKIAETFPEGRGSPHGCGLRAVFCTDAASARPEACRDKSKVPRSGDFAGRSPGVQGAAATGRPLCAPCAV